MTQVWRRFGLLAAVLVLIVGGGVTGVLATQAATDRSVTIRQDDREALRSAVTELATGYLMTMIASLLDQTTTRDFTLQPDSPEDVASLQEMVDSSVFFDQGAVLTDLSGRVLSTWAPSGALPPLSEPGYGPLTSSLMQGKPGVSSLLPAGDRQLVAIALPVPATGAPRGLLVGFARFDEAGPSQQFLVDLPLGPRTRLLMVDAAGVVLASSDEAAVGTPTPAVAAHRAASLGEVGWRTEDRLGMPYVDSFGPVDAPGGWTVTIEEPAADFLGPIRNSGMRVQLLLLVVLAVAAAVIAVLHHRRQAVLQQMADQALHDPLTGLANRILFSSRLDAALARPVTETGGVAVLFCDLDGFKQINDSYGHAAGDRLLVSVGDRLLGCVRSTDLVARMGGDEFTVLLHADAADPAELARDAEAVAQRIVASLATPVNLGLGRPPVRVGVSIGVSVLDPMGASPATAVPSDARALDLLRVADDAMYLAKSRGGGTELVTVH